MTHITLYRKYRSADFGEMVGQTHIIRTLSNAVTADRLAQAYIFSGPRGTGKTSSARIFAKALNCRKGPTPTPCGTCDLCQKITQGQSVDVIEMDAASHTGVDNIRVINDQVGFAPVECRYRLFIIDEVHMLSGGAFNALLKTLEEPPNHVVFILATTEPHKIPPTIHSRCQHLQFRSLSMTEIVDHLRYIANQEGFTVSSGALQMVARNASGCMRDALSLFDQLAAFGGAEISDDAVTQLLGAASLDSLVGMLRAMFQNDPKAVIQRLVEVEQSGVHPTQLLVDLIDLMKVVMGQKLGISISNGFEGAVLDMNLDLVSFDQIQAICEGLSRTQMDIKYFPDPLLLIQVRCAKLALSSQVTRHPSETPISTPPLPATKPPTGLQAGQVRQPETVVAVPDDRPSRASDSTQDMAGHLKRLKEMQLAAMGRSTPQLPVVEPAQPRGLPQEKPKDTVNSSINWSGVLLEIKQLKPPLFTILNDSTLIKVSGDLLVIRLKQDFQFFREKLREPGSVDILNLAFNRVLNQSYRLRFDGEADAPSPRPQQTEQLPPVAQQVPKDPKLKKLNHIIALFDGAIVEN